MAGLLFRYNNFGLPVAQTEALLERITGQMGTTTRNCQFW